MNGLSISTRFVLVHRKRCHERAASHDPSTQKRSQWEWARAPMNKSDRGNALFTIRDPNTTQTTFEAEMNRFWNVVPPSCRGQSRFANLTGSVRVLMYRAAQSVFAPGLRAGNIKILANIVQICLVS
eukprot:907007_1